MNFLQGFGVYIAAVLGVLFSRWWGPYRAGTLSLSDFAGATAIIELVGAMVGGVLIMAIVDREARTHGTKTKQRFAERAIYSFFGGVTIDQFIAGA